MLTMGTARAGRNSGTARATRESPSPRLSNNLLKRQTLTDTSVGILERHDMFLSSTSTSSLSSSSSSSSSSLHYRYHSFALQFIAIFPSSLVPLVKINHEFCRCSRLSSQRVLPDEDQSCSMSARVLRCTANHTRLEITDGRGGSGLALITWSGSSLRGRAPLINSRPRSCDKVCLEFGI